jgi:hypothetical protein
MHVFLTNEGYVFKQGKVFVVIITIVLVQKDSSSVVNNIHATHPMQLFICHHVIYFASAIEWINGLSKQIGNLITE